MKLLTRTYLLFAAIGLVVFLIGGYIFYDQLRRILDEETTEKIEAQRGTILNYVNKYHELPPTDLLSGFPEYMTVGVPMPDRWEDTMLYRKDEGETLPYRLYSFDVQIGEKHTRVFVGASLFEQDDLRETISYAFAITFALFLGVLLISSFFLTRNAWKPFFALLDKIKRYQPGLGKPDLDVRTTIREFKMLREQLMTFTERSELEFSRIRAFSENAAHELQTPLAVIQSKTEMLLQSPRLTEDELRELGAMQEQLSRMRKLNQTLLLLTKIDHGLYQANEPVHLDEIIRKQLDTYADLIAMKQLRVSTQLSETPVLMHEHLAEILIANLLTNAIKFTPDGGSILIVADRNGLRFENDGTVLLNPDKLFERFYKDETRADSNGLGLALVKSICLQHQLEAVYEFIPLKGNWGKHVFFIHWV